MMLGLSSILIFKILRRNLDGISNKANIYQIELSTFSRSNYDKTKITSVNPCICFLIGQTKRPVSPYIYGKLGWNDVSSLVTKPGAIISHGYPFHYTRTELWRWQIVFPSETFINLVADTIFFDSSLVGRFIICFATRKYIQGMTKKYQTYRLYS